MINETKLKTQTWVDITSAILIFDKDAKKYLLEKSSWTDSAEKTGCPHAEKLNKICFYYLTWKFTPNRLKN